VLSVALLLEHLGHTTEASKVEQAVLTRLASTPAPAPTQQVGDELASLAAG
jgi:3-isopropylmalate dehydrogenase